MRHHRTIGTKPHVLPGLLSAITYVCFCARHGVWPCGLLGIWAKATVSLAVDREIKQGDMFAVEVRIDTETAVPRSTVRSELRSGADEVR